MALSPGLLVTLGLAAFVAGFIAGVAFIGWIVPWWYEGGDV